MGAGGMGKTSVALAVINHPDVVGIFETRRHWIPCDQTPTLPLFLEHLAQSLCITDPPKDRLREIVSHLQAANTSFLLTLDNFETLWDPSESRVKAEDILSHLSGLPNVTILLTSRGTIPPSRTRWDEISTIGTLSLAAARATFFDINSRSTHEHLYELLGALDCVALAVTLVASVGRTGYTPSELLDAWKKERTPLLNLGDDRQNSIDISIRFSIQSSLMVKNPEALPLLSILAHLPGGIQQKYLSPIVSTLKNPNAAQRIVDAAALGYRAANGTLQMLSPIRSHILQHHTLSLSEVSALRSFYFSLAERGGCNPGDDGSKEAHEALSEEEPNVESVITGALVPDSLARAAKAALSYSVYLYMSNRLRTDVLRCAIAALQAHVPLDQLDLLPKCLHRLGDMYRMQYNYDVAIAAFTEAKTSFEDIGDQLYTAVCLRALGETYRMQNNYAAAITVLAEARAPFEAIGDRLGAAQCLQSLGDIYSMQNNYDTAIAALTEAKASFEAIGSRLGTAQCLQSLGDIYRMQNNYDIAIAALTEAKASFEAIGERLGAAQCLQSLGNIYRMQNNYDTAIAALTEAKASFEAIGDRLGTSQSLQSLGAVHRKEGHHEKAISALEESEKICRSIGNRHELGWCFIYRAELFSDLGRVDDARAAYGSALELFEDIGLEYEIGICKAGLTALNH
jgi:tetratricopeptide (TPR) repeat protein